jgi:hypothetical protein
MTESTLSLLWPDDRLPAESGVSHLGEGPNTELAVILLASGCSQPYIKTHCAFPTLRAVQAFCRDEEVQRAVAEMGSERAKRIGNRAMVKLERLLAEDHTDLRATVLAVRTGLEVAGQLKREAAVPTKTVRELSVPELNQLIEATRRELDARIADSGPSVANQ